MFLAPQAELDDGLLDVVATGHSSKLTFLRKLPKVFKGTHLDEPHVHVLRGSVIEVAADRAVRRSTPTATRSAHARPRSPCSRAACA